MPSCRSSWTNAGRLREHGCDAYIVSVSATEAETIYVTEVWQSDDRHAASLELPEVKEAIAKAMPMLRDGVARQELVVVGGLGIDTIVA